MGRWTWLAALALALALPAGGIALAQGGPAPAAAGSPKASLLQATAEGHAIMVEGRVVSASATSLAIVTPPAGAVCQPPRMCPLFLRASLRYEVLSASAQIFSNGVSGLSFSAIAPGSMVVVYGTLFPPAEGTTPTAGEIEASGIFVLSPNGTGAGVLPSAIPGLRPLASSSRIQ